MWAPFELVLVRISNGFLAARIVLCRVGPRSLTLMSGPMGPGVGVGVLQTLSGMSLGLGVVGVAHVLSGMGLGVGGMGVVAPPL